MLKEKSYNRLFAHAGFFIKNKMDAISDKMDVVQDKMGALPDKMDVIQNRQNVQKILRNLSAMSHLRRMSKRRDMSNLLNPMKRVLLFVCVIGLLGGSVLFSGLPVQAAPEKVQIGKTTSASSYIKADDWPSGPSVGAYAAVLMDAETGIVLYAKNPDTQMYPASITKIMTALLTLERSQMTDTLVCEGEALDALPPNYVTLPISSGEKMSIEDCMGGLLLYSANDAANALAVHESGSIAAFAELMNERAKEAGAKNTHFNNPSGLHEENHYTTAYDMCRIMRECVQFDDFKRLAGSRVYTLAPNNKRAENLTIYAKDKMLFPTSGYYYENIVCGKTGYTNEASNTLVSYAEKDGMKLLCCVMKCTEKGGIYKDTAALFDFGFDNFHMVDASRSDERFTLKDAGIFAYEDIPAASAFNIEITGKSLVVLPSGVSLNKVDTEIRYLTDAEDGCFAEIDYLYQGMIVGTARLKMNRAVSNEGENFDFTSHQETETAAGAANSNDQNVWSNIWNRTKTIDVRIVIGIAVAVVLIAVVVLIVVIRRKDDRIDFKKNKRRRRRW